MPDSTPILGLPYPTPDDSVDVPRDVKALADKLDAYSSIRPPLVSSLPASPANDQEALVALEPPNAYCVARYVAALGDAAKWIVIGGGPIARMPTLNLALTTADQILAGTAVTLAVPGVYRVRLAATGISGASQPGSGQFTLYKGGVAQSAPVAFVAMPAGYFRASGETEVLMTCAAGDAFDARGKLTGASQAMTVSHAILEFWPIRFGP